MTDRDAFIESNLRLVHSCCHKFTGKGIEYDDLYQAGCIGLIKAADNFDESRGLKFSTYAVPVILGEIKRLFRDGGAVKVGRTLKELSLRAVRERERLSKELGRDPTVTELAKRLSVSAEEAAEAISVSMPVVSLTYEDENGTAEIQLPTCPADDEKISDSLALKEVMDELDERDKSIITLRYFKSKTQSQTATELGMTQVQVSRRERAILFELRKKLSV